MQFPKGSAQHQSRSVLWAESDHEKWQAVRDGVAQKLARDYYWEVFEPMEQEKPEPVLGSLSNNLADIWRDLKPGVVAIDTGYAASISEAAWEWRFSF